MVRLRKSFLVLFALILGGGQIFAATREQRDFTAAAAAFQDGMWSRAEVEFAEFIEKHPDSSRVAEAVLMQAQADFKQGKLLEAIALLQAREPLAGDLADQYIYWTGQAQFQNTDYNAAAETFARLARDFQNSQWRLNAIVNEAAALAKLGQWEQVETLLITSGGIFQQAVKTKTGDERIVTGDMLLAEALLAQNHPGAAAGVLQSPGSLKLNPELDWRRLYLLCRAEFAAGDTNAALALTTNLVETANRANRANLRAESVAEQASELEKIGRLSDAMSVYGKNLANAPDEWQRQAVLKIAELAAAETNFSGAEDSLGKFLSRFPNSPETDAALLALGELHLKNYATLPSATNNDLQRAQSQFDEFIGAFTNSPLFGKAYLDRGWCFWIEGKIAESAADFETAAEKLPLSVDLAVARFKLGDAEFRQNDFVDARENYQAVADNFTNFPVVGQTLGAQALYQALRACKELKDISGESNAMARILKIYPVSNLADKSILLVGEGFSDWGKPESARALFQKFEEEFPDSEQLPDVELAIARTYEQENNWPPAIAIYDSWVDRFANDQRLLPSVEYARAWANFQAGRETNAFVLFTNFIARFPTNVVLAPVAQWWLGDYYSGRGDFLNAEKNYKLVFQGWPASNLAYPAKLMAGRAAMGRQGYDAAIDYFTSLTGDTNCPPDWDAPALFAYGDALMLEPSKDMNDPLTNFPTAISIFKIICQQYSGSEQAALAWGEIGDCYFQLAAQAPHFYDDATNAYAQVISSTFPDDPNAEAAAHSQAQIGIGLVFEKRAALATGTNQTALLQAALDNYLDVFFGNNLRNGEMADPFWVKEAGLQALPLIGTLGAGDPDKFIDDMEKLFPQLKDSLEKKRAELSPPKN